MLRSACKSLAISFARVRTLAAEFGPATRGNSAIIFAIDYSYASMVKTKLQAAADAATLATVSNNSPIVTTAKSMTGNGSVSGGSTYLQNFFNEDTRAFIGISLTPTPTVTNIVRSFPPTTTV